MLQAAVNAPFRPSCGRNYLADTTGRKGQGLWLRTDKSCSLLEDRRGITMYWLSCTLDVGGYGGMQVPGWMHLWCDLRCLFFCCEQLYFSEVSFLGSAETEIMLLRTYSCSSRTAKTKLFFKARSAAALQNRCMEFQHLVPAILRCGSVFRLWKKTWIPNFHFHGADTTWAIWACNFFRIISPFLFSHELKVKLCIKQCKRSDS